MSENAKVITGLIAGGLFVAGIVTAIVVMILDQNEYYKNEQRKQDKCLAAGGAWIDNRSTDSYCFFNK
jgi:CHASE3 domain sensor protein